MARGSSLTGTKSPLRGVSLGSSTQKKPYGGYFVSAGRSGRIGLSVGIGGSRSKCGNSGYCYSRYGSHYDRCGPYQFYNCYDRHYCCCPRFRFGFCFYRATYPAYYPVYTTVYEPYPVYTSPTYIVAESDEFGPPAGVVLDDYEDNAGAVVDEASAARATESVPVQTQQDEGTTVAPLPSRDGDTRAASMPDEEMHRLMTQGVESFMRGQYEESAQTFLRVAMADPDNVDATLAYATGRFATGDYPMSALAIRRGVRRMPEVVNSPFDIRDRYGRVADFDYHRQALEAFVQQRPDDADGLVVLGFVQHFTGQRELAAQTFERLKARSESDADLADVFLNARPLEELLAPEEAREEDTGQGATPTFGVDSP